MRLSTALMPVAVGHQMAYVDRELVDICGLQVDAGRATPGSIVVVAAEPVRVSLQDGRDAPDSRHAGRFFVALVGVDGAHAAPALILDVAHLRAVAALAHHLVVANCGDRALYVVMRSFPFSFTGTFCS